MRGNLKHRIGEVACEVCGRTLTQKPGRGRIRYQHRGCKNLNSWLSGIESILSETEFTPEAAARMRSRLWYTANLLNRKAANSNVEVNGDA